MIQIAMNITFNCRSFQFEKKNLVDLKSAWQHTEQESRAIYFYLFQFAMEILAASLFLLLDYLIVTLLEIIRIKSFVSYTQKGEHIIHFQVNICIIFYKC